MSKRYFSDSPVGGEMVELQASEAHHLLHVMRAVAGDTVTVFDGTGAEFHCRLVACSRSVASLEVLARHEIDRELPLSLTIGVALPKGDRQKWLVEKLVELGVTRLVPLATERSVAQPNDKAILRLRRTVVEASKQCGRNRLMDIGGPRSVQEWFSEKPRECLGLIAEPGGAENWLHAVPQSSMAEVRAAIGPEGGFTEAELAVAEDWQTIGLGPRILRVETAAMAVAANIACLAQSRDS